MILTFGCSTKFINNLINKDIKDIKDIENVEELKLLKHNSVNSIYSTLYFYKNNLSENQLKNIFSIFKKILKNNKKLYIKIKAENLHYYNKCLYSEGFYLQNVYKKNGFLELEINNHITQEIEKHQKLLKYYAGNKKTFVGFDFDGTLGDTKANTHIKRLIKKGKKPEKGHQYKIVLHTKDIELIKQATNIYFINEITYKTLKETVLQNNQKIKLTKYIKSTDFQNQEFYNEIKEILKSKEYKSQLTILKGSNKIYVNDLSNIDFEKLDKKDLIKIDINSYDINIIENLYYKDNRIQIITEFNKDELDLNLINKQEKIQVKISKTYKEILKNNIDYEVIEQLMLFDPITYNKYDKQKNDLMPDYSEFRDSKVLANQTKLYKNVTKEILKWYKNEETLTTILTARGKLSDKELAIQFFNNKGIPVGHFKDNKIHLFFSGHFEIIPDLKIDKKYQKEVIMKKVSFIDKILKSTNISKVVFYEDNLDMLKGLKNFLNINYKNIKQELYYVNKGKIIKLDNNLSNNILLTK